MPGDDGQLRGASCARAVGGLALVGSRVCAPWFLVRTPTMYIVGVPSLRRLFLTRHLVFFPHLLVPTFGPRALVFLWACAFRVSGCVPFRVPLLGVCPLLSLLSPMEITFRSARPAVPPGPVVSSPSHRRWLGIHARPCRRDAPHCCRVRRSLWQRHQTVCPCFTLSSSCLPAVTNTATID